MLCLVAFFQQTTPEVTLSPGTNHPRGRSSRQRSLLPANEKSPPAAQIGRPRGHRHDLHAVRFLPAEPETNIDLVLRPLDSGFGVLFFFRLHDLPDLEDLESVSDPDSSPVREEFHLHAAVQEFFG